MSKKARRFDGLVYYFAYGWRGVLVYFLDWLFGNKRTNANRKIEELVINQPKRIPVNFRLSMLIISDTHNCLEECDLPIALNHDVCFILGDLSSRDIRVVKRCVAPFVPVYGLLGNHDDFSLLEDNEIHNIHGKTITIKGVKVAGMQGSIRYKNSDYPLYSDDESITIANKIESADILISHDSPKYAHGCYNLAHSGLQGITEYCFKNNVPLNLHGHHHTNEHIMLSNGTLSICCHKCVEIDTHLL